MGTKYSASVSTDAQPFMTETGYTTRDSEYLGHRNPTVYVPKDHLLPVMIGEIASDTLSCIITSCNKSSFYLELDTN